MKRRAVVQLLTLFLAWPMVSPAQDQDTGVGDLNRGIRMLSSGQYGEAKRLFERLSERDVPEEKVREYRYYLGLARIKLGEYDQAVEDLEKVLAGFPPESWHDALFSSAYLNWGLSLLKAGRTRDAKNATQIVVESAPRRRDRDAARMLLGIAHYRLGEYLNAQQTLEPLVKNEESPYQGDAAYYTGLAEQRAGQVRAAKETLKQAIRQLPADLGQRAQTALDRLARMDEVALGPFNFRVTLELGNYYDTNVTLRGRRTAPTDRISGKDDYRFGLFSDFDFDWQPQEGALEPWHLNVGASIFESWHASIQEFNVQDYAARIYLGRRVYRSDNFVNYVELGLRYDYDYSLVDNDGFLSRNGVAVVANLTERDGEWHTFFEYQWQFRDYEEDIFNDRFDRDGNYQSFEVFQDFRLWHVPDDWKAWRYSFDAKIDRFLTLEIGYRHENNSTRGDEFDFDANVVFAGVSIPLPWNIDASFVAELEWQNYWQRSLIDFQRAGRDDFIQRYTFRLSRRFEDWLEIGGQIAWTYDDANVVDRLGQEVYSYDRLVSGLTARVTLLNPHTRRYGR